MLCKPMSMCGAQSVVSSAPAMPRRKTQGGQHEEAPTATHTGGTLCTSVQRPAGHGPVRVRPTAGAQGLRQGQRLLHRPPVRRRGRERTRGRQTPVPGDDRGGKQTQRSLRGHPRLEVQPRFTRKREHAVAFKSMLRRKGIRVVSITEHADDSPTGKLMEAIIESVDEFYSENLAQEVVRGMREPHREASSSPRMPPSAIGRSRSATGRRSAPPWRSTLLLPR